MRRALILLSCLALLAAAACAEPPTAQQMIDASLVRLTDITPAGVWMVDSSTNEESKSLGAAFDDCRRRHDPTMGTADGESDLFTRRDDKYGSVSSSAAVVLDSAARKEFFQTFDELVRCDGAAIERVWEQYSPGLDVVVRGPFSLPIHITADRVVGRSLEVGLHGQSQYIDIVAVERDKVVLTLTVSHEGEMHSDDMQQILEKPLDRLAGLSSVLSGSGD